MTKKQGVDSWWQKAKNILEWINNYNPRLGMWYWSLGCQYTALESDITPINVA